MPSARILISTMDPLKKPCYFDKQTIECIGARQFKKYKFNPMDVWRNSSEKVVKKMAKYGMKYAQKRLAELKKAAKSIPTSYGSSARSIAQQRRRMRKKIQKRALACYSGMTMDEKWHRLFFSEFIPAKSKSCKKNQEEIK